MADFFFQPNQTLQWYAGKANVITATANLSLTAGAVEIIDYNSVVSDISSFGGTRFTTGVSCCLVCPNFTSILHVNMSGFIDNMADTKSMDTRFYVANALYSANARPMASGTETIGSAGGAVIVAAPNAIVDFRIFNGDASNRLINITANFGTVSWFGYRT